MTLDRAIPVKINDSFILWIVYSFQFNLRETYSLALSSGLKIMIRLLDYCSTVTSAIARLGHFTPPARVDFATEAKAERRCQARSGELPTILRTEAARCGRKRAATLLAPELETLEQPLPPIALYVSIYVFPGKRGTDERVDHSRILQSSSRPSLSSVFVYWYSTYIIFWNAHVHHTFEKSRINADKKSLYSKLNFLNREMYSCIWRLNKRLIINYNFCRLLLWNI